MHHGWATSRSICVHPGAPLDFLLGAAPDIAARHTYDSSQIAYS